MIIILLQQSRERDQLKNQKKIVLSVCLSVCLSFHVYMRIEETNFKRLQSKSKQNRQLCKTSIREQSTLYSVTLLLL